jgi:hypothetical protein
MYTSMEWPPQIEWTTWTDHLQNGQNQTLMLSRFFYIVGSFFFVFWISNSSLLYWFKYRAVRRLQHFLRIYCNFNRQEQKTKNKGTTSRKKNNWELCRCNRNQASETTFKNRFGSLFLTCFFVHESFASSALLSQASLNYSLDLNDAPGPQ